MLLGARDSSPNIARVYPLLGAMLPAYPVWTLLPCMDSVSMRRPGFVKTELARVKTSAKDDCPITKFPFALAIRQ